MGNVKLVKSGNQNVTMISNKFIDEFMPHANGEFVKVYLYLLRLLTTSDSDFSLGVIADVFNHTEMDVMRALKYWEKAGILELTYSEDKELSAVNFVDLELTEGATDSKDSKSTSASASITQFSVGQAAETAATALSASAPHKEEKHDLNKKIKPEFTKDKIQELTSNEDVKMLLYIVQTYIGKTLSPSDTNVILYFYDTLGFSVELIEYLIEYCVSNNHKTLRYIETVALTWAEAGITDVAAAKAYTCTYSKLYFSVLKAFGISGRTIADSEREYIVKWTDEYHFDTDIILNACNRTISAIHQPSFQYTDSILSGWSNSGVKSISDIEESDKVYMNTRKKASVVQVPIAKPKTSFANYAQRTYNNLELERDLLKRK